MHAEVGIMCFRLLNLSLITEELKQSVTILQYISVLEITALTASLIPRECKQAIISSQEDKQDIKFKEGAIKCCKEKNFFPSKLMA